MLVVPVALLYPQVQALSRQRNAAVAAQHQSGYKSVEHGNMPKAVNLCCLAGETVPLCNPVAIRIPTSFAPVNLLRNRLHRRSSQSAAACQRRLQSRFNCRKSTLSPVDAPRRYLKMTCFAATSSRFRSCTAADEDQIIHPESSGPVRQWLSKKTINTPLKKPTC